MSASQFFFCFFVCFSILVSHYGTMLALPSIQLYQTTRFTVPNNPNDDLLKMSFIKGKPVNKANEMISLKRLEEGSFCKRRFDGKSGYCILAYQCLHAIKEFRVHGIPIDICTHRRKIPVICCALDTKEMESTGKRLSSRKCDEYNEHFKSVTNKNPDEFSGKKCVASMPLIVGGEPTTSGEYPHMAALGWTKEEEEEIKWGCGASLISHFYILTAAHCTTSGGSPPDIVKLGIQNINEDTEALEVEISKIIVHPKYRSSSYYHDIALIKLAKKVEFTENIKPVCLWQLPHLNIPEAMATGWGRTEFLGPKSEELQKVDLNIIDPGICQQAYSNEKKLAEGIIEQQFCAGHLDGGKDTCQGDSGGPIHAMVPELNCVQFIIGITSFGKFCAARDAPGVYTKIFAYLDWIEKYAFEV